MNQTSVRGRPVGLALVLCGALMSHSTSTLAAKGPCEPCRTKPTLRMTAGMPKEPRAGSSRIGARRIHGLQSLAKPHATRSARRSLMRLDHSRMRPARQEQTLDSARIRVIDGNTFSYGMARIRVQGFDAEHSGGEAESIQRLDHILHQGGVTMIPLSTDVDGRIVAQVFVDQRNVADVLLLGYYASMLERKR